MAFIVQWVKHEKTSVPKQEIIKCMSKQGMNYFSIIRSIDMLVRKGYIRKSQTMGKQVSYIQLRSI